MTKQNRFQIIKDTREKKGHGWWYDENAYCSGTTVAKVDIGDYAIEGMEHILQETSDLEENCDRLIEVANDNGGTDNITVILVRCGE